MGWPRWFATKGYAGLLHEDHKIRRYIKSALYHAGISRIDIERSANSARITIFNLKQETMAKFESEFQRVSLRAGYVGSPQYGLIFDGDIKQTRSGREQGHSVNTYIEILAAEFDQLYNFTIVEQTLSASQNTPKNKAKVIADALGLPEGFTQDLPLAASARGKVMFGLTRVYGRQIGESTESRFSLQRNGVHFIPNDGFVGVQNDLQAALANVIVMNSETGMVGVPEVTQDGVKVRCLMNPAIQVGSLIKINNKDIQGLLLKGKLLTNPGRLEDIPGALPIVPRGDGLYRVMVHEFAGDTRGQEWYSNLVCLTVTPTGPGGLPIVQGAD